MKRGPHEQGTDSSTVPTPGEATAGDRRIRPGVRGQAGESPLRSRAEDDPPLARSLARGGTRRPGATLPASAAEPAGPRVGGLDRTCPARTRIRRAPCSGLAAPRPQAGGVPGGDPADLCEARSPAAAPAGETSCAAAAAEALREARPRRLRSGRCQGGEAW